MPSQWEDRSKPHRNIVFIGHVDHGKSTTVGRLLLDSGHIEEHVIEKNEKLAAESGKAGPMVAMMRVRFMLHASVYV